MPIGAFYGAAMMHLVVLLALFGGASSNVIGIDFGTELIKVALVQPGSPLEIVTNTISKRKTEACISFDRGDRMFGADAFGLLSRKPQFTYAKMTTLLGRTADHASVKALSAQHFPTEVYFNETRGGLCVKSPADYWTPEELTAMILSHVKDITKAFGGKLVRDCVITVPMYFTQHERAALLDAAEIADMRVLSLIDENTAAALQYSLDRVFEEPQNVLFFNMGSQSTQVSIVQYSSRRSRSSARIRRWGSSRSSARAGMANLVACISTCCSPNFLRCVGGDFLLTLHVSLSSLTTSHLHISTICLGRVQPEEGKWGDTRHRSPDGQTACRG